MPKKCDICNSSLYKEISKEYVECKYCGTKYTVHEINNTVSEEEKRIEVINRCLKGACEIRVPGGAGAGWYIGNHRILTNHHVVYNFQSKVMNKEIYAMFPYVIRDKYYTLTVEKADPQNDIALLYLEDDSDLKGNAIKFGSIDDIKIGTTVYTIGNPCNKGITHEHGQITMLNEQYDTYDGKRIVNENRFRTSLMIHGGNSGGALLNTEGEAIGMIVAVSAYQEVENFMDLDTTETYRFIKNASIPNLSSAIKIDTIKDLIENGKKYELVKKLEENELFEMLLVFEKEQLPLIAAQCPDKLIEALDQGAIGLMSFFNEACSAFIQQDVELEDQLFTVNKQVLSGGMFYYLILLPDFDYDDLGCYIYFLPQLDKFAIVDNNKQLLVYSGGQIVKKYDNIVIEDFIGNFKLVLK